MRRASALLLALATILASSACTRSVTGETPPNLLMTGVAATLTAAIPLPSSTPAGGDLPPSATPPPSATTVPPEPATLTPTATEGPGPTATPPSLPAGDPRTGLDLSQADYTDDFSVRFQWYEFSDPSAENLWEDGRLRSTDLLADSYVWWSTSDQTAANLYAEISAQVGECSARDAYGFAIRVGGENYDRGYALEFSCGGSFRIRKFVSGAAPVTLLDWTQTPAIHAGPNALNRMGFLADGNHLYAIANGEVVGDVEDADYVSGTFGLYASSVETPGVTVLYDDFALWIVTP
jgi:hypothetical protein